MSLAGVPLGSLPPERFREVMPPDLYERFSARVVEARDFMRGRVLWNVNSTAQGGGVAEMLRPLLSYARGAGIDARWLVIQGDKPFFEVTKRLHNRLHGSPGDGGELDGAACAAYEHIAQQAAEELAELTHADDIVILHDPQTAGMEPALAKAGVPAIWRCHIGVDSPNELALSGIRFLLPYVKLAPATVFSRDAYIWPGIPKERARIIAPSIDAFSPKNEELTPDVVHAILARAGVIAGQVKVAPVFTRTDGSPGRVDVRARMVEDGPLDPGTRTLVQVSRWDRLKDHGGVLRAFCEHPPAAGDVHLVLAGPDPAGIADDPEAAEMLAELEDQRAAQPAAIRARTHLALLPMNDVEENAAIVNALQRHATVVAQKSLAEGFGLTVAEAMWKARPVVASRVGGIQDQVEDGVTGLLVPPTDLEAFALAVDRLLSDPKAAAAMGEAAQERVRYLYLGPRHLMQYLDLLEELKSG